MEQDIQQILEEAFAEGQNTLIEGKAASCIPELAKTDSSNLGCCIMSADGSMYKAGDYNILFTMQSIAKIFLLILALQTSGYSHIFSKVGMESTGNCFNSIPQLELKNWWPPNPMTDASATVTADCIAMADPFRELLTLARELCGNPKIRLNEKMYHSEKRTGTRSRLVACLLKSDHVLDGEPEGVLDVYFHMCLVIRTAKDLTHYVMTLSSKGMDLETRGRLLDADVVRIVTTLMILCGMYGESGEYAIKVGPSSKSGVGGSIVVVGQSGMDIDTFGPMLNEKGNSMGGERILQYLSECLGYHIFI